MSDLKFRPPIKISIYLTVIQYSALFILLPIVLKFVSWDIYESWDLDLLYSILLVIDICALIVYFTHTEGLIVFTDKRLEGYSFGQFGRSYHFVEWDDIYQVQPHRHYGLPFLLVRYHSSDTPLWLPLFLNNQNQLNLILLEHTTEDSPLHVALLQRDRFKQLSWHSKARKYKSDRSYLESAYTERIYFSFKKCCLYFLSVILLDQLLMTIVLFWIEGGLDRDIFIYAIVIFPVVFFKIIFILMWQLGGKNSYVAIKDDGIEFGSNFFLHSSKYNISWSKIVYVKPCNCLSGQILYLFIEKPINGRNIISVCLPFINKTKFKTAVINKTHPEHPLHQAVIKHL